MERVHTEANVKRPGCPTVLEEPSRNAAHRCRARLYPCHSLVICSYAGPSARHRVAAANKTDGVPYLGVLHLRSGCLAWSLGAPHPRSRGENSGAHELGWKELHLFSVLMEVEHFLQ